MFDEEYCEEVRRYVSTFNPNDEDHKCEDLFSKEEIETSVKELKCAQSSRARRNAQPIFDRGR